MARIAKSLDVLRDQIDEAFPGRKKTSDGWLGDAAHAARTSDHNPNENDVVTALDITHDPASGVNAGAIAEQLRQSKDRRIKYIIWNWKIANYQALNGEAAWAWRPYSGSNGHTQHFHLSVRSEPELYDSTERWDIGGDVEVPDADIDFQDITATYFDDAMGAYGPIDHEKPGVALPYRFTGKRPQVRVYYGGKSVVCDIVDVGPWNTNDPYWTKQARPQAETGKDLTGRKTNKAGIDLNVAAKDAVGLPGKGIVDWEFVGEKPPLDKPDVTVPTMPTLPSTGGIDWQEAARRAGMDLPAVVEAVGRIRVELNRVDAILQQKETGKTTPEILEEMEMTTTKIPETVKAEVKPAMASKINWAQIASIASMAIAGFTGVQLELDPTNIAITVATVGSAFSAITMILRTWFTKSVTVQAVQK